MEFTFGWCHDGDKPELNETHGLDPLWFSVLFLFHFVPFCFLFSSQWSKFVVDLLGCASWVHNILITVMTHIVVDKSTGHAKPHSICFVTTISKILTTENTDSDLKVHALHYANDCLYASDFPFKNFYKLAYYEKTIRKNVWETSNDTYLLSVRVQTTINHISICFLPQCQRQRKCFSSERELKRPLRGKLTRAAWYGL